MTERFGSYEVVAEVATGSTSTVYRARHRELDREAAIKVLRPEVLGLPGMRERLRHEAELLADLEDPHVVAVYDYVEDDDASWIAEEWIDGASLARILEVHRELTPEQAVGVLRDALLGLAHAHDLGIVHHDVSPTNILADLAGRSKLVDYGLAAPAGESGAAGTPAFMSPEATRGEVVGKPSDVYSCAAVLYALLAGSAPFAGSDLATTLRRHAEEPAPVLEGHGHDLQALVRRGLAKNPAERPQDAREFLAELEEAARRRFGAGWIERASIAGLVASAVVPLGVGAAVGGAAAPTVVVDAAAGIASVAPKAARSSHRALIAGLVAGAVVVGAVGVTYATTRGDDGPANAAADLPPVSATPTAVEETPDEPTLEDLTPAGRMRFTRILVSNTYDTSPPKRESRTWTLDLRKCVGQVTCSGTISSSSGSTFKYSWDGKRLDVTSPKNGVTVYTGPCIADDTGEEVPGSKGRATETVTWIPLRTTATDADGLPTRLEGKQRVHTTYEGLSTGCRDSPTDRALFDVILEVRR